jgi:hypothetical protein
MPYFQTVVWLDHAQGRIFGSAAAGANPTVIDAGTDPHGDAHGSPRVHHKANVIGSGKVRNEPAFFGRIAAALDGAGEILVLGPGLAKREFVDHVKAHVPSIARRIVAVETADRITDNQIVARARLYYGRAARSRPQLAPLGD